MIPEEKAEEIKNNYLLMFQDDTEGLFHVGDNIGRLAIRCATISVDEIILSCERCNIQYWIDVKIELLKL